VNDVKAAEAASGESASASELRDRWSRMTDVHQFFGILKSLRLAGTEWG
jgi:putative hemin transport protein